MAEGLSGPFGSARLKIERAKHHVNDLAENLSAFLDKDPYKIVVECEPDSSYKVHKARLTESVPSVCGLIVGDAIGNLRAALDHMTHSVAILNGHIKPGEYCTFPFPRGGDFSVHVEKTCSKLPKEIRTILCGLKPDQTGNRALWALNQICNRDKHTLVRPVCILHSVTTIKVRSGGPIESPRNVFWNREKNEIELFRTLGEPEYDHRLLFLVTLDGTDVPILDGLIGLVEEIERVLGLIETETRSLFPGAFV